MTSTINNINNSSITNFLNNTNNLNDKINSFNKMENASKKVSDQEVSFSKNALNTYRQVQFIHDVNKSIAATQSSSKIVGSQINILNEIKDLTKQYSNNSLNNDEKNSIKTQISDLTSSYDKMVEESTFDGEILLDGTFTKNINDNIDISIESTKREDIGKTRFETTDEITKSGEANISFNVNGEDIKIDSANIDSDNMEESLKNLSDKINELSKTTAITAEYKMNEDNSTGKLVLSKQGSGEIDYSFELGSGENSTKIETKNGSTFDLSNISKGLTENEALSLGINKEDAKKGIDNPLDNEESLNMIKKVLDNSIENLENRQSDLSTTKEKLLSSSKTAEVVEFDKSKLSDNGSFSLSYGSINNFINQTNVARLLM